MFTLRHIKAFPSRKAKGFRRSSVVDARRDDDIRDLRDAPTSTTTPASSPFPPGEDSVADATITTLLLAPSLPAALLLISEDRLICGGSNLVSL
jgi:hypothetical protein